MEQRDDGEHTACSSASAGQLCVSAGLVLPHALGPGQAGKKSAEHPLGWDAQLGSHRPAAEPAAGLPGVSWELQSMV